ncbi:MAG: ABC transporter ATP-binding protein [Balneolaceae bacterium]|nr:ABC transporter ATP-binding protein [Balneolaceae bacterium]
MSAPAVIAEGLAKSYKNVQALKDLSLRIANKELFGIIGPDGAGKSTLFRILASLIRPDAGRASVLGMDTVRDYRSLRPLLGYMPGKFGLYRDLSVVENLAFFASVFGTSVQEGYELIEPIYRHLEPFKNRLAGDLSGGMKQKLALSCALVHRPHLLLLDEPTTGVDAVSRQEFWQMLGQITGSGITVVVSTPYMDEARRCDRVALMQQGRLLRVAPPDELASGMQRRVWAVKGENRYALIGQLRSLEELHSVHPFGASVHVTAVSSGLDTARLEKLLRDHLPQNVDVREIKPGVEDVFMELMDRRGESPE